ncbi:galactokinase [Litorivicinus lipolyticus]|uniref:galactokinase n=1 Tax=Litorivicinus lipolyticus TaxID=418701 RepID=UPI003B5A5C2B
MTIRAFAPGRVNLIGDHIDYLGGDVLPMALALGTRVSITPAATFEFISADYPEVWRGDHWPAPSGQWYDYLVGCLQIWPGPALTACRIDVAGDLPRGSGLSSSASLEVAVLTALNHALSGGLSATEIAVLGQRVEREWIGLNCGIMDQYASAHGRAGHALRINCGVPAHTDVALNLGDTEIWVVNSKAPRGLPGSLYNQRVAETAKIARCLGVTGALAHCPDDRIGELAPALQPRLRHVVSEQARVGEFVAAAASGDVATMGALMNASHDSLRDDYQVSGPDLDALQVALLECQGVLGARMTGGGFGGCVVALVAADAVTAMQAGVAQDYAEATGRVPDFIAGVPSAGAHIL